MCNNKKRFDFLVHSVGDGATTEALAAVAASKVEGFETRHRLTHLEIVDPGDYAKFAQLGVIADFQVLVQTYNRFRNLGIHPF